MDNVILTGDRENMSDILPKIAIMGKAGVFSLSVCAGSRSHSAKIPSLIKSPPDLPNPRKSAPGK